MKLDVCQVNSYALITLYWLSWGLCHYKHIFIHLPNVVFSLEKLFDSILISLALSNFTRPSQQGIFTNCKWNPQTGFFLAS